MKNFRTEGQSIVFYEFALLACRVRSVRSTPLLSC